jgi:hypothetical protein
MVAKICYLCNFLLASPLANAASAVHSYAAVPVAARSPDCVMQSFGFLHWEANAVPQAIADNMVVDGSQATERIEGGSFVVFTAVIGSLWST